MAAADEFLLLFLCRRVDSKHAAGLEVKLTQEIKVKVQFKDHKDVGFTQKNDPFQSRRGDADSAELMVSTH